MEMTLFENKSVLIFTSMDLTPETLKPPQDTKADFGNICSQVHNGFFALIYRVRIYGEWANLTLSNLRLVF